MKGTGRYNGYRRFLEESPTGDSEVDSYKKVERFMEIMKKDYSHIRTIYVPIGGTIEID